MIAAMSNQAPTLLIIDDDRAFLAALGRALNRDFSVAAASTENEALRAFNGAIDIVLLDIRLDEVDVGNRAGMDLLQEFLKGKTGVPIVMTSAYGDIEMAVECMRLGATDFVQKA